MAMIEDQIISNVTCDVGKRTKISSFLKSEEISPKPWGKFHLLFQSPSLSSRSLLFSRFCFCFFFYLFIYLFFYFFFFNAPLLLCLLFCYLVFMSSVLSLQLSLCTQYHVVVYM